MTEETKNIPTNMLTAEELLENKGLKYNAWDEYEKSSKTLPKTGMKQFEPNNSWLQNMQIEKGIMARKNLIAIERVDRISQLASAEWLPAQKKAKVKKYSGQDWSSFGLEKGGTLYLIPEEALFLLEANCLELTWNDVSLSIQQAYELLIDNVECSLEEYRVYSQLVRYGYRIQRFVYNSEKNTKGDETSVKRKVIVEPENGLWMADIHQQNKDCTDLHSEKFVDYSKRTDTHDNNFCSETCQETIEDKDISDEVHEIVDDLLCAVENIEAQSANIEYENNMRSKEKSDPNSQSVNMNGDKKKRNSKVEIISDETLLGNIKIITDHMNDYTKGSNISTNWRASRIQRNVKLVPRRTDKLPSTIDILDSNTTSPECYSGKHKLLSPPRENSPLKKSKHEVIELSDDEIQEVPKPITRMDLLNLIPNIAFQSTITIKISRGYIPHSIKPLKTIYHYDSAKLKNLQQADRRYRFGQSFEHINNNASSNFLPLRKLYHQRIVGNTSIYSITGNILLLDPRPRYWPRHHKNMNIASSNDEFYQSSFKVLPGVSSWSELKTKWREIKTITIDDEDIGKEVIEDSNEVQVVGQLRNPLVGSKSANSLEEVFSKLKIIKSAPEKITR
ncbi:tRNA-splicing endonuclease subunit Sen54 [Eufriesea mexicana]|uniref:tRNA-splicing endonuclease subunit Sen54 n=1 Tax=Eufriesea mexicana TaxID=516756 RepID=A0A310SRM9_9HYME|nr:tRNA-splicing endonuclease subunit Sen54 [Eufriesea mexicana]